MTSKTLENKARQIKTANMPTGQDKIGTPDEIGTQDDEIAEKEDKAAEPVDIETAPSAGSPMKLVEDKNDKEDPDIADENEEDGGEVNTNPSSDDEVINVK